MKKRSEREAGREVEYYKYNKFYLFITIWRINDYDYGDVEGRRIMEKNMMTYQKNRIRDDEYGEV